MIGPRSLRARLTLVFTGATMIVVLVAASGAMLLLDRTTWEPIDAVMTEEAEGLATVRNLGKIEDLKRAADEVAEERDLGGRKFIRVSGSDGRVLVAAGLAAPYAPNAALAPGRAHTVNDHHGNRYRIFRYAAPGGGWTEVGVEVRARETALHGARLAIGAAATILLGLLALLAWTITTRATAELERLAAEIETIEAGSLDRRLTAPRTSEVERLVSVLNRVLGRLEAAMVHLQRFTADAAHELRTPIAALRARLEVAIGATPTSDAARDGLLDALEQTERLGSLSEALLTLSAVEAGGEAGQQPELVHLDHLVREVAESLEPIAQEQDRRFACRAERTLVVRGMPDLLKRVLINLVDNAFRHTPSSAAVMLSADARDGVATLAVHDDGPGIAASDVPRMFERFRRGRAAGAGTGLGLALCREIVNRHGGRITVESVPGRGTTFTVTLPLAS